MCFFLLPVFFYLYKFGSFTFSSNQSEWGTFGDYLGGVIGTILTAIAAIFVYKTYQTQEIQLELQKKEANQTIIDNLFDKISKEVDDFEITFNKNLLDDDKPELISYKGIFVLYNLKELYNKRDNSVLNQLNLALISFEHLFTIIKKSTYKWDMQLEINLDRSYLLFYTKIIWPIHRFYKEEWNKLIVEWKPPHPDSLGAKSRFEKLLKEAYSYLLKRNLVGLPEDDAYKKILSEI